MRNPILVIPAVVCAIGLTSTVTAQQDTKAPKPMARFAKATGKNLNERSFALPQDFEADWNIVFMAYQRWQQEDVNTWLPMSDELEARFSNIRYYELPTINEMPEMARKFVDNGMRRGIPDPRVRARTITLYLDQAPFMKSLKIENMQSIDVFVSDRDGNVVWKVEGTYDEEKGKNLTAFLEKHARERPETEKSIVETASGAGAFETLLAAAKAAGLVKALQGDQPMTVFAPTDEAFAKLGKKVDELLEPENRAMLQHILLHHVVRGYVDRESMKSRKRAFPITKEAVTIKVGKDGSGKIGGAKLVGDGIPCTNGIVHVVDSVLVPKTKPEGSEKSSDKGRGSPR